MPRVKCSDKKWRYFINNVCQDCLQRVSDDIREHVCTRLEEFPDTRKTTKPARGIAKEPLEDMPIDSVKMILAGKKKFMNYGKKV